VDAAAALCQSVDANRHYLSFWEHYSHIGFCGCVGAHITESGHYYRAVCDVKILCRFQTVLRQRTNMPLRASL